MSARPLGITCVLIAVLFEAFGQLALKRGAESASSQGGGLAQVGRLWRHRVVIFGIACFVVEAILWTMALRLLDVSVAFPAGSLCLSSWPSWPNFTCMSGSDDSDGSVSGSYLAASCWSE